MIDRTSLRIGNIIRHTNSNGTFTLPVHAVQRDWVDVMTPDGGIWGLRYDEIDGLPLSVASLEAGGFAIREFDAGVKGWEWGCFIFDCDGDHERDGFQFCAPYGNNYGGEDLDRIGKPIRFLHELQNLASALGEELPVNITAL